MMSSVFFAWNEKYRSYYYVYNLRISNVGGEMVGHFSLGGEGRRLILIGYICNDITAVLNRFQ